MSEKKNTRLRVLPVPGAHEYLLVWDRVNEAFADADGPLPDRWIFTTEEVDFE